MSFDDLGLSDKVLAAVTSSGYTQPTPIQTQAIPHVMARRDVLGIAQTGTGKTAAFTLPMLTLLEQGRARARMPRTLILEPTRELAAQVEENFIKYGVNHKLSVALIIGGVSFGDQDAKLTRGVDVLIATPGRLLDHHERGKLLLTGVELLVIDEADRMLDMGFIPDIERICKLVPFTRQTLFFTATMPPEITRISEQFLHNPVRIEVSRPASTSATITQRLVASGSKDFAKREVLRDLIRDAVDLKNAIIFCNRKSEVAVLHRSLVRHGLAAVALHGDMDQKSRMAALDSFRKGEMTILVASDVAARGLDIPDVSHVFNYDMPHHAEDYVHRIGRTGRAGRAGASFTLVTRSDEKSLAAIEKLIGQTIEWQGKQTSEIVEPEGGEDHGGRTRRSPDRRRGRSDRSEAPRRASTEPAERAPRPAPVAPQQAGKIVAGAADDKPADRERPARSGRKPERERGPGRDRQSGQPQERHEERHVERHVERSRDSASANEDGPRVKGMGDHVPAFLMRSTNNTRR